MKPSAISMAQILRLTRTGNPVAATRSLQRLMTTGKPDTPFTFKVPENLIDVTTFSTLAAPELTQQHPSATGGTVQEKRYTGDAGTLGYRLYLPENHRAAMPLVIMLHGCTQSPEDFALGTAMDELADELGFIVAYPRQSSSANAQKCWNWFKPGDQQRGRGEPAMIAGIVQQIVREQQADAGRVYVAGLSAGGAAAAILADQYPDLFAAVGVHSGLACGSAQDLPSALSAMRQGSRGRSSRKTSGFVPTITFHGDRDMTVNEANSVDIIAAAKSLSDAPLTIHAETGQQANGRTYTQVVSRNGEGASMIEQWTIHGGGHAWSGGRASGSYTDPKGPDASREMLRFFLSHRLQHRP